MKHYGLYLISGVFFEEHQTTRLGFVGSDIDVLVDSKIGEFLYIGVLQPDPEHLLGGYKGIILDGLGYARLRNVVILDDELRFEKQYVDGRPHATTIKYIFRRENERQWLGEYSLVGTEVKGPTRCILQSISLDFFRHNLTPRDPTRAMTDLLREHVEEVKD